MDPSPPQSSSRAGSTIVVGVLLTLFAYTLIRTAWLCDDAYITLRTIDNAVRGLGAGFNAGERVQAYTHPLWLVILTPIYAITREAFFTTIAVAINLSLITAAIIALKAATSAGRAVAALIFMLGSKAFVDFSTSGLEDPLAHLIVAVYFLALLQPNPRHVYFAILAGAAMLTRLDLALVVMPALIAACRTKGKRRYIALGLAPAALWLAVATFYYGSPWPNSAYAKLGGDIPAGDRLIQGLRYLLDVCFHDPVTAAVILAGVVMGAMRGNSIVRAMMAGAVLYLIYVVWIGGDFMAGRMLTAPFVCAVCAIVSAPADSSQINLPFAAAALWIATAIFVPVTPMLSGSNYGADLAANMHAHGIADERGYYYPGTGLLTAGWPHGGPSHPFAVEGRKYAEDGMAIAVHAAIGMRGYYAGPGTYIIDANALADPVLARLPAVADGSWRVGHLTRALPEGYIEAMESGDARAIEDAEVRGMVEEWWLITRDPIFAPGRLRAIAAYLLTRTGPHAIDIEHFKNAPKPSVT